MQETAKALALIQECYPRFMDGRTPETTVAIWAKMFPNEAYPLVEAAVMAFVATDVKGFPPSIGQVKEKLAQMQAEETLDEAGAWALVATALRNGIYGSAKEYAKLPAGIQRAVGSANQLRDWATMDMETINSVVCSNFMRNYRARAAHTRELQKLPDSVRQMYIAAGDAFSYERALPAPPQSPEPEPEPVACPESVRGMLDTMRQKAEADKVESAKRKVAAMMQRFGINNRDARS